MDYDNRHKYSHPLRRRRLDSRSGTYPFLDSAGSVDDFWGDDRRVAFLRATPIRGNLLGPPAAMDFRNSRTSRQLLSYTARATQLADCEYWPASCAPFVERHSILSLAARAEGLAGASQRTLPHHLRKCSLF